MDKKTVFRSAGLKMTNNRLQVLDVLDSKGGLSARDVWQALLSDGHSISFATVYRVLSNLCQAGLARKMLSENGALYELTQEEALPQLICERCGKVETVDDPELLRYKAEVMKSRGLTEDDSLFLYTNCKRKECISDD